jgi:hypothetical protein
MRRSFARVVPRQRNSQLSKLWVNRHDESDQKVLGPTDETRRATGAFSVQHVPLPAHRRGDLSALVEPENENFRPYVVVRPGPAAAPG